MARYHRPTKVLKCPKCGAEMKMGERVYMTLAWEQGDRYKRLGTSSFLCRGCAGALMDEVNLDKGSV